MSGPTRVRLSPGLPYSEISQVKVEYSLFWIASCTQFSDMALLSLFFFTEIDGIFKWGIDLSVS